MRHFNNVFVKALLGLFNPILVNKKKIGNELIRIMEIKGNCKTNFYKIKLNNFIPVDFSYGFLN